MNLDPIDLEIQRVTIIARFAKRLALVCALLAVLPAMIGWMSTPTGSLYLGIQTNLDDHMVYAAWMRQAMEGRFLFDNRFAVDAQPGLTIHIYFYVLGLLAKLTGIPVAMLIARLGFTYLFVILLGRFLTNLKIDVFKAKYMLMIACFGGGVGFLVWEKFGQEFVNGPEFLKPLFLGLAPIDVWQPEAFVFPSMLTNGLFMVSLCLIVVVFQAVLAAKTSWKPVLGGAVATGVLMNIHSYDVLLVGLVLVGFLATQIARKQVTGLWIARTLVIVAGALPAALWFLYVIANDPVFQARAATPTFSPNFRQVLFGLLPLVALALLAAWHNKSKWRVHSFAGLVGLVLVLFFAAEKHNASGYFLQMGSWIGLFALSLLLVGALANEDDAWNLAWAWAVVGLVAIYFPALFQRKLAMGIVVPWALLAAFGLARILQPLERSTRNLVATLSLCLLAGSSLAYFLRENYFIRANVGRTAVHAVYFSQDVQRILQLLNQDTSRKVMLAMPGVWSPSGPADFKSPLVSDLNPILSGLAGVYTYAGHWSETPDYNRRRGLAMAVFLGTTTPDKREAILREIHPDYIVALNPSAFPEITLGDNVIPLADLRSYGTVVYEGNQLLLIRVN